MLLSDWTPAEKGLLAADLLLAGILIGWLTSPLKKVGRRVPCVIDEDETAETEAAQSAGGSEV